MKNRILRLTAVLIITTGHAAAADVAGHWQMQPAQSSFGSLDHDRCKTLTLAIDHDRLQFSSDFILDDGRHMTENFTVPLDGAAHALTTPLRLDPGSDWTPPSSGVAAQFKGSLLQIDEIMPAHADQWRHTQYYVDQHGDLVAQTSGRDLLGDKQARLLYRPTAAQTRCD